MIETQVLVMLSFFQLSKEIGNHVYSRQGIQVPNKWMGVYCCSICITDYCLLGHFEPRYKTHDYKGEVLS
jgi:hypothetical protein